MFTLITHVYMWPTLQLHHQTLPPLDLLFSLCRHTSMGTGVGLGLDGVAGISSAGIC